MFASGVPSALALSSTVAEQEDVQAQAERHPKKSGGIFRSRTGSGRGGCVEGGSAGGHGEVSCGGDKACGKMATKTVEEEKEKDLPLKGVDHACIKSASVPPLRMLEEKGVGYAAIWCSLCFR